MKVVAGLVIILLIAAGVYFYVTKIAHTPIGDIRKNPRDYYGRTLTIAGEVTDRTSLFVVRYFRVKDNSGEIVVVTGKPLPGIGARVRVRGKVEEAFSIGSQQMLVFVEEGSGEEKEENTK